MSELPHQAIITPMEREAVHHLFQDCIICRRKPDIIYSVKIPMKWIDDETFQSPVSTTCCSEEHALIWLNREKPRVKSKDRRFPSETEERGWIEVYRKHGAYPDDHPLREGKWLVFISTEDIDRFWRKIRAAVELGKLGNWAKVSTKGSLRKRKEHVICVYTYDYEDREDVMRIREILRKIGVDWRIRYKSNEDTSKLQYGSDYKPKYLC